MRYIFEFPRIGGVSVQYGTAQYAIWYALQMSSLVRYGTVPYGTVRVTAAFWTQNAAVRRTKELI